MASLMLKFSDGRASWAHESVYCTNQAWKMATDYVHAMLGSPHLQHILQKGGLETYAKPVPSFHLLSAAAWYIQLWFDRS